MNMWRKPVVTIAGGVVVLAGIVMLAIPGPGLLTIAAGVAIWATEYVWAARLLQRIKGRIRKLREGKGSKTE
jgi:uncharacterized protein (TIGR02611 family)